MVRVLLHFYAGDAVRSPHRSQCYPYFYAAENSIY
jgi:hypothetical protein